MVVSFLCLDNRSAAQAFATAFIPKVFPRQTSASPTQHDASFIACYFGSLSLTGRPGSSCCSTRWWKWRGWSGTAIEIPNSHNSNTSVYDGHRSSSFNQYSSLQQLSALMQSKLQQHNSYGSPQFCLPARSQHIIHRLRQPVLQRHHRTLSRYSTIASTSPQPERHPRALPYNMHASRCWDVRNFPEGDKDMDGCQHQRGGDAAACQL